MGGNVSVSELTELLAQTYRTIDLRVAVVREGDEWVNALAVVRLTYEEPSAADKRLLELGHRYTPVATNNFKILLEARPFSEWKRFCSDCEAGVLQIGGSRIKLRQPVKVPELAGELRLDPWGLRPFDGVAWRGVFATVGTSDPRMAQEPLVREISPLGYSFPLEAVNEFCGVNVAQGQNPGQEFYMSAPVFARIENARFLVFEKELQLRIQKHADIDGISGTLVLRGQNFAMAESSSYRKAFPELQLLTDGKPIQTMTSTASDVPDISLDTWVEIKLVHARLGEIQQIMPSARSIIPPAERNVLFESLKHFCPEAVLHQLVVAPHSRKTVSLKTSAAFELHVAWLLGLCGLTTVVLGEYEHLVAPLTKIPRGSVDVLASSSHSDTLFLVACTLGPPKEDDFGNLLNVRGILEKEVFDQVSVSILPLVFTGARDQPEFRTMQNELVGIPIMDAGRIEILLSLIREGSEKEFFEFLRTPNIFKLRKPNVP
jgi:hypothetical protein